MAINLATPTSAPEAIAHPSASFQETSGSSGLAGGSLPVVSFQPAVATFLASVPAPTAAPVPSTLHANDPTTTSCGRLRTGRRPVNHAPSAASVGAACLSGEHGLWHREVSIPQMHLAGTEGEVRSLVQVTAAEQDDSGDQDRERGGGEDEAAVQVADQDLASAFLVLAAGVDEALVEEDVQATGGE